MSGQKVYNGPSISPFDVESSPGRKGGLTQEVSNPPFPEVPIATQRETTWVNGLPTAFTFKDALGATKATRVITWVDGNPTTEVWTFF